LLHERTVGDAVRGPVRRVGIVGLVSLLALAAACGSSSSKHGAGSGSSSGLAGLLPGTWHIVSYASRTPAGGSIESAAPGTDPTVTFAAVKSGASSGQLQVAPGCNSGGGPWKLASNRLTIGPIVSTMMACPDPQVNQQDSAIVKALESAHTVKVAAGELTILDDKGAIAIVGRTATAS
jgi:heat shock protein HslJ